MFPILVPWSYDSSHLAPALQVHTPHPPPGAGGVGGGGAQVVGGAHYGALAPHRGGGAATGDVAMLDAAQTMATFEGGQHENIRQGQYESKA